MFVGADAHIGPFVRIHRTAIFTARPQLLLRRPSSSQTPQPSPRRKRQVSSVPLLVLSKLQTLRWFAIWFRLSCQKKWANRGAGCDLWRLRADAFQRPVRAQDKYFSNSLWFRQIYHTQLRIVDSRFCFCSFWEYSTNCAHLLCFVGADDSVRPVRFSHTFVGADAHIGPYRPVSNIGTISYREINKFAPVRAFRPRSGQKLARVSAQYNASPAHLFAYFFWRNRKSRSAKQWLQCNCKRGSSGANGQWAHRTVRPDSLHRRRKKSLCLAAEGFCFRTPAKAVRIQL